MTSCDQQQTPIYAISWMHLIETSIHDYDQLKEYFAQTMTLTFPTKANKLQNLICSCCTPTSSKIQPYRQQDASYWILSLYLANGLGYCKHVSILERPSKRPSESNMRLKQILFNDNKLLPRLPTKMKNQSTYSQTVINQAHHNLAFLLTCQ